jgi:hypothetical protein
VRLFKASVIPEIVTACSICTPLIIATLRSTTLSCIALKSVQPYEVVLDYQCTDRLTAIQKQNIQGEISVTWYVITSCNTVLQKLKANSHIPCRAPTMPLCRRYLKATAQHGRDTACPGSISSDYHAESDDWQVGFFRLHAEFHEGQGTVGGRQRHGMACVN